MPPLTKRCACGCGEIIDMTKSNPRKKYFSDACRRKAHKRKDHVLAKRARTTQLTPAMQRFRELRESEDDYVRDVLQDVVRDLVTEAVHDNVLGAAEILTGLLPMALAGLADDLQHGDEYIRGKARQDVLKYALDFRKKDGQKADFGKINIITALPLPDTPLGHATAQQIIQIEEDDALREVEAFEQDWPRCSRCKERKHPDLLHIAGGDRRHSGVNPMYCSSCRMAAAYKRPAVVDEEAGSDE